MNGSRTAVLLLVVLTGCGSPDAGAGRAAPPAPPPGPASTAPLPAASPTSSGAPAGGTELLVQARDRPGAPYVTHRLRCDPPGGDHPRPRTACRDLAAAAAALAPAPTDQLCTQQYGGPQTARISGTYRGRPVDVRLERTDGCAIARWEALGDVLPPLD